jgi:protein gp37
VGETTKISWCDSTFNPWVGCTKVSPGCTNCYAEVQDHRWGHDRWGPGKARELTSKANWALPIRWNAAAAKAGVRRRVFCGSLCDVFDPEAPVGGRARLWDLIHATDHLDWLLLTKRPERFGPELPLGWHELGWPRNVWLGVTVENQEQAEKRIPLLLEQDAVVRFLSCEPMLEDVGLNRHLGIYTHSGTPCCIDRPGYHALAATDRGGPGRTGIDWVIVGGESGSRARSFRPAWARGIRDQCKAAGVRFFMKQLGAHVIDRNDAGFDGEPGDSWNLKGEFGRVEEDLDGTRDGYQGAPVRVHLKDARHGGDIEEFPPDLRVRQFPEVRR